MQAKIILIAVLIFSNTLFAQNDFSARIKTANLLSYNYQLDSAQIIYNSVLVNKPDFFLPYLELSRNESWKYLSENNQENFIKSMRFNKIADSLLDLNENLIEESSFYYYKGFLDLIKTALYTQKGETSNAFWSVKSSYEYFEEALEINPQKLDALTGLGLYNYSLSFVPSFAKFFIELFGLEADKGLAVKRLEKVYFSNSSTKWDAGFQLAKIYREYTGNYEKAEEILQNLLSEFPNNPLFRYEYILLLYNQNKYNLIFAQRELMSNSMKYNSQLIAYTNFICAEAKFRLNDFNNALYYYEKFFKTTKTVNYLNSANFHSAVAEEFLKNKDEANRYKILGMLGESEFSEDIYARDYLRKNKDINEKQLNLIFIENLVLSEQYGKVKSYFLKNLIEVDYNSFLGLLYLETLIGVHDYSTAKNIIAEIKKANLSSNLESYFIFLQAKYLLGIKDINYAKKLVSNIGSFEGFEYESELKIKVNRLRFLIEKFKE